MTIEIIEGDNRVVLKELADNSVDSIVTDPPYGLNFMGKKWDYDVPGIEVWRECLRVLKPGGHLLSFFGTRTYHRGVVPIEDAGFEIRDQIAWVYGSGFPKSSNQHGEWEGWGTALKPAQEPIVVARKPLIGTMEKNLAAHGVGALNIDGCRVSTDGEVIHAPQSDPSRRSGVVGSDLGITGADIDKFQEAQRASIERTVRLGRWPANLLHDGSDEVLSAFPDSKGQQGDVRGTEPSGVTKDIYGKFGGRVASPARNDGGSAARFFYCAKASKADRDDGVRTPPKSFVQFQTANGTSGKASSISEGRNTEYRNGHPTVKPTDLMRYLCRLVTPPGGTVLDPFMGSGSTGRGAVLEGLSFIGIEMDTKYFEIADARILAAEESFAMKQVAE